MSSTEAKRNQLLRLIDSVLAPFPEVKGVVAVGSVASGAARPDSDIDAFVFMDPFDPYIVPAEFIWSPSADTYTSIFSPRPPADGPQFDLTRVSLAEWARPDHDWPDGYRNELAGGWIAFDRDGEVATLIDRKTSFDETQRVTRVDHALVRLDHLLNGTDPEAAWENLGAGEAHDRLNVAFDHLVSALFAINHRWRPWPSRRIRQLLALPWLPEAPAVGSRAADAASRSSATGKGEADEAEHTPGVADAGLAAAVTHLCTAHAPGYEGYAARFRALATALTDIVDRLRGEPGYGDDPMSTAFKRTHEEPGRSWNMDEWNARRRVPSPSRPSDRDP